MSVSADHQIRLGVLVSHLRQEEKLILAAGRDRGLAVQAMFDRHLVLDLSNRDTTPEELDFDVILDRAVAHSRAAYILRVAERFGIPTLNPSTATVLCDDKAYCSTALAAAGVPTVRTLVAFDMETALQASEQLGYPVVIKPVTGSWGRLLAKVNGPVQARAIIEQKQHLGSFHHSIFYIQEFVDKPDRDIRVFVIGDNAVAASYRTAEHWITNTARGAQSFPCPITPEIEELSIRACHAVGAGIAGVDLIETADGLKVIEVNTGSEFHGLISTTDRDIPGEIVDYAVAVAERKRGIPQAEGLLTPGVIGA